MTEHLALSETRSHAEPAVWSSPIRDDDEVSALALVNVLLRYRRFIVAVGLTLGVVSLIYGLLRPSLWSSEAAFVPQGRSNGGAAGLSGLAAQFGVAVPTIEPTQSSAFYQDLLRTDAIVGNIVDSALSTAGPPGKARTVADLYRVDEQNPALRRARALEKLDDNLDISVSSKTGLVRLAIRAPDPIAAQLLTQRALLEVTRFNVETRQSQASAERRFIERRMADARAELRSAEERLREFSDANRGFAAAGLVLQRDRLARDVALRQDVYASLAQSYERARIDEVRDTPVITIVQAPERPVRPDSRGLIRLSLLSLVGGMLIGSMLAFCVDFFRRKGGASAGERAEFDMLMRRAAT